MDRNTLLAFFLISIVLVLTPKYIELVSPTPDRVSTINEPSPDTTATPTAIKTNVAPIEIINKAPNPLNNSYSEEKSTEVITDLYSMVVSSTGGGTIKSFKLNKYFTSDSQAVELINNNNNLVLAGKDLDGEPLSLLGPWELITHNKNRTNNTQELIYKKEVFDGQFIYKNISFYHDNYLIDVGLDLSGIANNIYRDVSFGWGGGLSPTEKNLSDDLYYFNSYVYQGGELENLKVDTGDSENKRFNGEADWAALRTKYFAMAIIPKTPDHIESANLSGRGDSVEVYGASFVFDPTNKTDFRLYVGPLEYDRIKSLGVGLEAIMDFGWSFIRPISKGVLYALKKMHGFIPNYGFVLIVFAFLVKLIVYPLTKKSYQSTSAMQALAPEINSLKEKYKSNPQKLNQATMELYKARGVNPLGGCLPMLLQMPLLFALFQVFRTTIELRSEPFVWWITDLSSPDTIFLLPFNVPIYGNHVAVLPILMVISMFVQQKMMTGAAQQPQQKTMQYFMTGFFFLMFNGFPSGLNLYYTLFNVLTIAQQKLIPPDTQTA